MKRWKKIVLLLLGLILISQLPFIYRRYRLSQLQGAIQRLNGGRSPAESQGPYTEYRGVMHVHSMLGGHSTGGFEEIIRAARSNNLHFVVMTEHPSANIDTAEMTLDGMHGGVLFVGGSEIVTATGDRLLLVPGNGEQSLGALPTQSVIEQEQTKGRMAFVAYPQEFRNWEVNNYAGIEVYNLYTNARSINYFLLFFDGLWSYGGYPELLFSTFYRRPDQALAKWDEQMRARRLVAVAGNDAHANVGLHVGEAAGKRLLQIQLDPYERSFRVVRNHVLIERDKPLSAETLLSAIRDGHTFFSFDLFCDATGFFFSAENRVERKIMGDEIGLEDGVRLRVNAPVKCRIVLFKDGQRVMEERDSLAKEFAVKERGAYRVEVYLDQLGPGFEQRPWIITNPIYVR